MSTSVARDAVVAGEGTVTDDVEDSEIVSKFPGFGLVYPHQRGMDDELLLHGHVEGDVQTADKRIATVGISRKISLTDAGDDVERTDFAGINGSDAEKEQVTARDEGVGQCPFGLFLVHDDGGVGKGIVVQLRDETDIHHPEVDTVVTADFLGKFHLDAVFLSVDEGDGIDFLEMVFGPEQAGGGVLSAAEHDEGPVAACTAAEAKQGLGERRDGSGVHFSCFFNGGFQVTR